MGEKAEYLCLIGIQEMKVCFCSPGKGRVTEGYWIRLPPALSNLIYARKTHGERGVFVNAEISRVSPPSLHAPVDIYVHRKFGDSVTSSVSFQS